MGQGAIPRRRCTHRPPPLVEYIGGYGVPRRVGGVVLLVRCRVIHKVAVPVLFAVVGRHFFPQCISIRRSEFEPVVEQQAVNGVVSFRYSSECLSDLGFTQAAVPHLNAGRSIVATVNVADPPAID